MADISAGPLIALYYASVGALLLAVVHGAILASRTPYVRSNWCYVAAGIGVALYQICCVGEYTAPALDLALVAHKWKNLTVIATLPIFLAGLTYLHPSRRLVGLLVANVGIGFFLAIEDFRLPYGLRYTDLAGTRLTVLPWG